MQNFGNQRLLDSRFRGTVDPKKALFEEDLWPRLRRIRLWRQELKDRIKATGEKSPTNSVGTSTGADLRRFGGEVFFFDSHFGMWSQRVGHFLFLVRPDCDDGDAISWMRAFRDAEAKNPALQNTWDAIFILGGTARDPECVVQADPDYGIVEFFNHPNYPRLFAALVADATDGTEVPVTITRMIHHEAAHLVEIQLLGEIADLALWSPLTTRRKFLSGTLLFRQP